MALIENVHPDNAKGRLAQNYQQIENAIGYIPEAFHLFSVSPELFDVQMATMAHISSRFNAIFISMLRYFVSEKNRNAFCIGFNEAALVNSGINQDDLRQALIHPEMIPLSEHEKRLMLFVLRAIDDPEKIGKEDIDALHKAGWSDQEIYEALYMGAHHVATDVLFNAFKVSTSIKTDK